MQKDTPFLETISALNVILNEYNDFPKKFCLTKLLGWSDTEAELFLKEYKKEKNKKLKMRNKIEMDKSLPILKEAVYCTSACGNC